ncbi:MULTISPECIES: ATP-binding protein [unclassified Caballeronia]|uniref:ATP-binding protein n=1 Tax=unclassified Caballeronia TaxID=2646786 RepID=UPI0028640397|nr:MULTISPECIES: ATP-binding protein [unclassified Caballeronia]MDR5752487.1 ATP-binding protein [Caballeronia sp. LZ024]MDR5845293.1 ATP-binding protein [Caballeronia sp. LZ031]
MRHFFATTLGQILAIVACSSAATFMLFIALLFYPGAPPSPPWPWQSTYRIEGLVNVLRNLPRAERASALAAVQRPNMAARLIDRPVRCSGSTFDTHDLEAVLKEELSDAQGLTVRSCDPKNPVHDMQVIVPLGDATLEIRTDRVGSEPPRFTFPFFGALLFLCVGVAALSAWAVSRVIRPLRRLSEKADAFGRDIAIAPIEEEGPLEIRRAAHAFNLMQERITRSMQSRTRMLAAISHDLRTPLTRMRLQTDNEDKEIDRAKLSRDIELMQTMVASALTFLTSNASTEKKDRLDLGALLETLCDEYAESGVAIRYEGPAQIPFLCRPDGIQRVFSNLMDNAIHFGKLIVVTATVGDESIRVDIADDGPGIPPDRLGEVIEPFVRLDHARTKRRGSVGLGLSIVDDIVRGHNGTLTLFNRPETGLIARVTLPISED